MAMITMAEAYQNQVRSSRKRGIGFLITFEEWRDWWLIDDRWSNRGRGGSKFVMARKGDMGPYSLDNVYLATSKQNLRDIPSAVRRDSAQRALRTRGGLGYDHLKSDVHPRRAAIRSPDGEFASIELAAKHYGVSGRGIRYRLGRWDGWERVLPDQP